MVPGIASVYTVVSVRVKEALELFALPDQRIDHFHAVLHVYIVVSGAVYDQVFALQFVHVIDRRVLVIPTWIVLG